MKIGGALDPNPYTIHSQKQKDASRLLHGGSRSINAISIRKNGGVYQAVQEM